MAPLAILLVIRFIPIVLFRRRTHALPASNARLITTALTSQTIAGIFGLEMTRQLVDPALAHHELAAYSYRSIIAATSDFTLGANHWGRFYLARMALL